MTLYLGRRTSFSVVPQKDNFHLQRTNLLDENCPDFVSSNPLWWRGLTQAQASYGNQPFPVTVTGKSGSAHEATTFISSRVIKGSGQWEAQYTIVASALPPPDRHLNAIR